MKRKKPVKPGQFQPKVRSVITRPGECRGKRRNRRPGKPVDRDVPVPGFSVGYAHIPLWKFSPVGWVLISVEMADKYYGDLRSRPGNIRPRGDDDDDIPDPEEDYG